MSTRSHAYGREPNTRRQFLGLLGMAAVGATLGAAAREAVPARGLRPVWRKTAAGWERVRMYELRPGDLIRIEQHPTVYDTGFETVEGVVSGEPSQIDGQWTVTVETVPSAGHVPTP